MWYAWKRTIKLQFLIFSVNKNSVRKALNCCTKNNNTVRLLHFQLMELISSALRDLSESQFVGRRDSQNNPLPSPFEPLGQQHNLTPKIPFDPLTRLLDPLDGMPITPALVDWTKRNMLSAGSLLGKSCQGTMILAGHGEQLQKQGFLFGKHLSLSWQVKRPDDVFSVQFYPTKKSSQI